MRICARLLLATLVTLAVTVGATLTLAPSAQAAMWAPRAGTGFDPQRDLDQFEARILIRVNKARARHGLPKVRVFHSCVDQYAEKWTQRLRRTRELDHRDLTTVLRGCRLNWVGENLVAGEALRPGDAVAAWLASPSHRQVLLKHRARWAGIGVGIGSDGRTYAVLNFGDRG